MRRLPVVLFVCTVLVGVTVAFDLKDVFSEPSLTDQSLKAELMIGGLSFPTSMAFVDNDKILILEREGKVRLVSDGQLQEDPVLVLSVDLKGERGLLGIAVMKNISSVRPENENASELPNANVFIYFTEASPNGELELRNRVYRYGWNGMNLDNPTLILDLPAIPGPDHNGGKLVIGPDRYLYTVIGDLNPPSNRSGLWQPSVTFAKWS